MEKLTQEERRRRTFSESFKRKKVQEIETGQSFRSARSCCVRTVRICYSIFLNVYVANGLYSGPSLCRKLW